VAVSDVLRREPGVALVASCADADTLLAAIDDEQPDVVVTEQRFPPSGDKDGIRIAQRLRTTHPLTGVVVLAESAEPRYARALIAGGGQGRAYLLKDGVHDYGDLQVAIEVVARQGSLIDPGVLRRMLTLKQEQLDSPLAELTAREHAVLASMASGKSNAAIADQLVVTKRAVEKYLGAIFLKLGLPDEHHVSRRVTAVLLYLSELDMAQTHALNGRVRASDGVALPPGRNPPNN
jgi:DNA-binding NarL/FixJ family response regulator